MIQNQMKKRIAIIGAKGLPAQDGISRVVEEYISYITDEYNFTIFCTAAYTHRHSGYYDGYEEVVLSAIKNKRLNTLWYYIKAVWIILFCRNFDMIHFHHCDSAFLFPLVRLKYHKRILVTTHGAFTKLNDKWKKYRFYFYLQYRVFLKMAPNLTAVSNNESIKTRLIINRESEYIPNGINPEVMISGEEIPTGYVFFAAGRIMEVKGLDTMLYALIKMNYKGKVLVAGDITYAPQDFRNKIQELSKRLDIKFLGMIKEKARLFNYIRCARLFIFPSVAETMSMQLLEVASLKVPIIASDIKENTDVFSSDEILFFKTSNADDLAEKIKFALSNEGIMSVKAELAYKTLLQKYTWEEISKHYARVYDKILNL